MVLLLAAAPSSPPPELTQADATGVLSRMVLDGNGREIGRIVDVVVDPQGTPRAVVIDVGGFMGVGARRVAVTWSAAHVPPPGAPDPRVTIDMTDEQVRDAPAYNDRSKPATIGGTRIANRAGCNARRARRAPASRARPRKCQTVARLSQERTVGGNTSHPIDQRADRSAFGLDWLNFFVSNVQTGFGPFIAVFLAAQAWTQGEIGLALSIGTLTTVAVQIPAGAMVDAARSKRSIAFIAVVAIAVSAVVLAALPERLPVIGAEVLHGAASCLLVPAIAA